MAKRRFRKWTVRRGRTRSALRTVCAEVSLKSRVRVWPIGKSAADFLSFRYFRFPFAESNPVPDGRRSTPLSRNFCRTGGLRVCRKSISRVTKRLVRNTVYSVIRVSTGGRSPEIIRRRTIRIGLLIRPVHSTIIRHHAEPEDRVRRTLTLRTVQ